MILVAAGQIIPNTSDSADSVTASSNSISDGLREELDSHWSSSEKLEEGEGQAHAPFPPPPPIQPPPLIPANPVILQAAPLDGAEEVMPPGNRVTTQPLSPPRPRLPPGPEFPRASTGSAAGRATADYNNLIKLMMSQWADDQKRGQLRREEERRLQQEERDQRQEEEQRRRQEEEQRQSEQQPEVAEVRRQFSETISRITGSKHEHPYPQMEEGYGPPDPCGGFQEPYEDLG